MKGMFRECSGAWGQCFEDNALRTMREDNALRTMPWGQCLEDNALRTMPEDNAWGRCFTLTYLPRTCLQPRAQNRTRGQILSASLHRHTWNNFLLDDGDVLHPRLDLNRAAPWQSEKMLWKIIKLFYIYLHIYIYRWVESNKVNLIPVASVCTRLYRGVPSHAYIICMCVCMVFVSMFVCIISVSPTPDYGWTLP